MPETITKFTVVYTLDELKTLADSGDRDARDTYDNALSKVKEWSWEGWEASWFTEDIHSVIEYDFPEFDLDKRSLEWDLDRKTTNGTGSVRLVDFLTNHRLRNKFRLLWAIIKKHDLSADIPCKFRTGYHERGNADTYEFQRDIDYYEEYGTPRHARICAQVEALEAEIGGWTEEIHDRIIKLMRDEENYRWSDEFAVDEANAQELKFTEDGDIFHG